MLRNQGGGVFGTKVDYFPGGVASAVAFGDVNGDGKLDLATANGTSGTLSVFVNDGIGGFKKYGSNIGLGLGAYPTTVALADVDGDGNLDLVSAHSFGAIAYVLRNQGDGTFEPQVEHSVGANPNSVAVSDFDGDGKLDVAAANLQSESVSVLRNAACQP